MFHNASARNTFFSGSEWDVRCFGLGLSLAVVCLPILLLQAFPNIVMLCCKPACFSNGLHVGALSVCGRHLCFSSCWFIPQFSKSSVSMQWQRLPAVLLQRLFAERERLLAVELQQQRAVGKAQQLEAELALATAAAQAHDQVQLLYGSRADSAWVVAPLISLNCILSCHHVGRSRVVCQTDSPTPTLQSCCRLLAM